MSKRLEEIEMRDEFLDKDTRWLIKRIRKLEEALKVYAHEDAFSNYGTKVLEDGGDIARKALEESGDE